MRAALKLLVKDVLNDERVKILTYRKLSVPTLLGLLGHCSVNLMIIGRANSWIVNARTAHPQHFVGTHHAIAMTKKASSTQLWKRLEVFALKYTAPGSRIKVFCCQ